MLTRSRLCLLWITLSFCARIKEGWWFFYLFFYTLRRKKKKRRSTLFCEPWPDTYVILFGETRELSLQIIIIPSESRVTHKGVHVSLWGESCVAGRGSPKGVTHALFFFFLECKGVLEIQEIRHFDECQELTKKARGRMKTICKNKLRRTLTIVCSTAVRNCRAVLACVLDAALCEQSCVGRQVSYSRKQE